MKRQGHKGIRRIGERRRLQFGRLVVVAGRILNGDEQGDKANRQGNFQQLCVQRGERERETKNSLRVRRKVIDFVKLRRVLNVPFPTNCACGR